MKYTHNYTDDPVWQMHARRAQKGNRRSVEWLSKRGWSPKQAEKFIQPKNQ